MKERPIPFIGPMVRAILDGRKTQTRRVVTVNRGRKKIRPTEPYEFDHDGVLMVEDECGETHAFADYYPCPYGKPGDRLWVRETWSIPSNEPLNGRTVPTEDVRYAASSYAVDIQNPANRWRPSIHMPRWASRLLLEITDVRVQRVQDISEADAEAEGVLPVHSNMGDTASYIGGFYFIWGDINEKRGFGWNANPWVWTITFRRVEA